MERIDINIKVTLYRREELSKEDGLLVDAAMEATANAYAKYSHFRVGAAARLANGLVVKGANQENAAFPSSLCAERTALFAAQANYPDQPVVALAVAASTDDGPVGEPVTPCGACRQVLLEVEERYGGNLRLLLCGSESVYVVSSARDLLPLSFADASMKG